MDGLHSPGHPFSSRALLGRLETLPSLRLCLPSYHRLSPYDTGNMLASMNKNVLYVMTRLP